MLDWHSCQICYPLEIKILLLLLLCFAVLCDRTCICSAQSRNRYNSRIVLRKVGILTLLRKVGILTLRKTILELVLRKVGIGTKWE